jgi:protein-S-isoprenylcysteine O-methyltransferase Ste14
MDPLKFAAYIAYLAAWVVIVAGAVWSIVSRTHRATATEKAISLPVVIGTLLQCAAAIVISWSIPEDALNLGPAKLIGILILAPLAAAAFTWAMRAVETGTRGLVTQGCYRWLRHPIYLAFLAMLAATGLLVAPPNTLAAALLIYLIGTELRIAAEEAELVERFPADYPAYRQKTRWRYLPPLR